VKKSSGLYPCVGVDAAGSGVVSQAGGVALVETVRVSGLDRELSAGLSRWRRPLAVHDPGKVLLDLAVTLALGGDCLADVAVLRAEPGVYGRVASDPTVSRTVDALAADAPRALDAIDTARASARAAVWRLAGRHAPDHEVTAAHPLVIDVDATLVTSHSDKEAARPTFKRGYGHHPLWVFADHGQGGTGEPLAVLLRPGNAGSNTAADHITVLRRALAQLPAHRSGRRPGRKVLVRVDGAGATHDLLDWLTGQRLSYSVGFGLPGNTPDLLELIPEQVWQPAYDGAGGVRDGAWVAELTGLLDLTGWPPGIRVIARKERPHPGAQLRITDVDGLRVTAFATNTAYGQLADLPAAAPPPGPLRGPDPHREGHRPDQPAPARHEPEPDLVRPGRAGLRAHRMAADAHPARPPRPPLGTQTAPAAAVLHRRPARPHRPPHRPSPPPRRTVDPPAPQHGQHPAKPARADHLTVPNPPDPTTAGPPTGGTGAPGDPGRTVTPP